MIKYITNDFNFKEPSVRIVNFMVKAASEEVEELLKTLKPDENKFYVLVIALGAGEYWGSNRNGDYFSETDLIKSYKTFEQGHAFFQHQNDDPTKSVGKVIKAFWNDKMKRVELIVEVDRQKGQNILKKLEAGETVDVSMGCKVNYDICSICGHKSKTRSEYCEHLKFHMNEILPDGRQVYAINPNPVFFDISFVRKGADPTAKVLLKVASEKGADIEKEVPAIKSIAITDQETLEDIIQRLETKFWSVPDFPKHVLLRLAKYPLGDVIATLTFLNIQLKPTELEELLGPGIYFADKIDLPRLMTGKYCENILNIVEPYISDKALYIQDVKEIRSVEKPSGLIYDAYKQAMVENLAKMANYNPESGIIWYIISSIIRRIIAILKGKGQLSSREYLSMELARRGIDEEMVNKFVPIYKYAFERTFIVPGFWYAFVEKILNSSN